MAKHYIRVLIEQIEVTDNHVKITAKSEAALKMLAAGGASPGAADVEVKEQEGVLP